MAEPRGFALLDGVYALTAEDPLGERLVDQYDGAPETSVGSNLRLGTTGIHIVRGRCA